MSAKVQPQHHVLCRWVSTAPCTCGLDKLRAEVASLKRRIRLARKLVDTVRMFPYQRDEAMEFLDLRRPLPKRGAK